MLVGARESFTVRSRGIPTAENYVSDGLVALWDGIENAGYGVHDPTANTWKDLSGNGRDLTITAGSFDEISFCPTVTTEKCGAYRAAFDFAYVELVVLISGARDTGTNKECLLYMSDVAERKCCGNILNGYSYMTGVGTRYAWSTPIRDGKRHHIVLNYATHKARVDGSDRTMMQSSATVDRSAGYFMLSGRYIQASTVKSFSGHVYAMRAYSRALSAAETAHNYAIDKRRFDLP